MSNTPPFSLRIFIADGDPDGLRFVERSNWIGKAVMFPRALYTQVRSIKEFQLTGVYLLLGPNPDGDGEMLYVGEGDPVGERLRDHFAKKDFWNRAVFFVAGPGQLNKAHVQYLEAQLVARADRAKRVPLENGNMPTEPTLSDADRADMEVFLDNILGMLPVLGIHAFEQSTTSHTRNQSPLLFCKGKGIVAKGHDTPQGFIILEGSYASVEEVASLQQYFASIVRLRQDMLKNGVLVPDGDSYRFTQNYSFTSPSQASATVLGRSSNGRVDWQDSEGRTLKALQEQQAEN